MTLVADANAAFGACRRLKAALIAACWLSAAGCSLSAGVPGGDERGDDPVPSDRGLRR